MFSDTDYLHRAESLKGFVFVIITTGLIYAIIKTDFEKLLKKNRELSEHKNEIDKRESNFRNLFNNHAAVKLLIDPETGEIIEANRAAEKFYGWSKSDLKNMRITDINMAEDNFIREKMKSAREDKINQFIFKHQKKDGTVKDVEVISSKVTYNDKDALYSIIYDISQRRKLELELRKHSEVLEQSPVSIVITDTNGNIEYVNPKFTEVSGYTLNEAKNENPRILKSGEQPTDYYKEMWETILSGKTWQGKFHNKNKEGKLFWESAIISPIKNNEGEITNFVAIKEDITKQVEIENELKQYREKLEDLVEERTSELNNVNKRLAEKLEKEKKLEEELEESLKKERDINELKTKFIATVSHEFRTPLAALQSSSELIQIYSAKGNEEKKQKHINRVTTTVKYLTKLLDDVLTVSRADREILENNPENTDIKEFILSVVEETKKDKKAGQEIDLDFKLDKRNNFIDTNLLRKVIVNILGNSIDYSPANENITIEVESTEENLLVEIADKGIGINEEEIEYIFDAFYRTQNSIGTQGVGLGLFIAKKALDILEGSISVKSKINDGTTFQIRVPINEGNRKKKNTFD